MAKNKYTIKRWKNEQEWNDGDASDSSPISNGTDVNLLIAAENTKILNSDIFNFEIYETESGETYYHSNEE